MADILVPSQEDIAQLRRGLEEKIQKEAASGKDANFHPKDMERIKGDIWLRKFLENHDLDQKASLQMLWETLEWRKSYGTNDINESNINLEYIKRGHIFSRNCDVDGKKIMIFKSKLHIRGERDTKQLLRIFIYWIERFQREVNYDTITIFFDLADTGLSNLDLEYTKTTVNILKNYYPNAVNYLLIYELPWVLTAAFKIIKSLLPPKAVAAMRFVSSKNLSEFITPDNQLKCWGGNDDYQFEFVPEDRKDENLLNGTNLETTPIASKKVHFANLSPPETPMSDITAGSFSEKGEGVMLRIKPRDAMVFEKSGNQLIGSVEIVNIIQSPITYKIKTTSPDKFRVRPSTGILAPGANVNIIVVLQQGHQLPLLNKDKFLVMSMELSSESSSHDIAELWKSPPSNRLVEQYRLKCWPPSAMTHAAGVGLGDDSKNGNLFNGNGLDTYDRQVPQLSSVINQLVDTTNRLESQIKFNQTLQWITLVVFLLLSVAVVYILKIEINNSNSDYCIKKD